MQASRTQSHLKTFQYLFKNSSFQYNKSFMPLKAFKRMKYTVKMRGKWCVTHLRAKQMQNSAREKYKNMENEKSLWCNRQAGQWSNWRRIVCPRLWQKLWTKNFFRRHFLKIHVLPVPIMCPSCQLQWIFFSGSASELKIPLLKGFVPPTHFQKQVGWWNWLILTLPC